MMVLQGYCKKWLNGYGFIVANDGETYFCHWSNILKDGFKALEVDDMVEFNPEAGAKGLVAINVSVIEAAE